MKFIEQLSDTRFVVEMGKEDLNKDICIKIAHDYLQIDGHDSHCEDYQIHGPYGFANVVQNHVSIQIPIRAAQDILKTISDNEYLQESHLTDVDKKPRYLYDRCIYRYRKDGVWMVAIMDKNTGEFTHITEDVYKVIKSSNNDR